MASLPSEMGEGNGASDPRATGQTRGEEGRPRDRWGRCCRHSAQGAAGLAPADPQAGERHRGWPHRGQAGRGVAGRREDNQPERRTRGPNSALPSAGPRRSAKGPEPPEETG